MQENHPEEKTQPSQKEERIIEIELERLRDFQDHPFLVREDEELKELKDSIEAYGILTPLIVRPKPDGIYEIVSGHRRKYVAKQLGYRKVPVIIRVMDDDDAIINMVDANIRRETINISEKAFAIKMKYDAMRRRNGRYKKSSPDLARPKGVRTVHVLAKEVGNSPKQIQRYLKITELQPEIIKMLDNKRISFNPAYEMAYLSEDDQKKVIAAMEAVKSSPSVSQAQRIRRLGEEGKLTVMAAREILSEIKKGEINRVMFKNEQLYQFFPRDMLAKKMKQRILDILQQWQELTKAGVIKDIREQEQAEETEETEETAHKEETTETEETAKGRNAANTTDSSGAENTLGVFRKTTAEIKEEEPEKEGSSHV